MWGFPLFFAMNAYIYEYILIYIAIIYHDTVW